VECTLVTRILRYHHSHINVRPFKSPIFRHFTDEGQALPHGKNVRESRLSRRNSLDRSLSRDETCGLSISAADRRRYEMIWRNAVVSYIEVAKPTPQEYFLLTQKEFTVSDFFPYVKTEWETATSHMTKSRSEKLCSILQDLLAKNCIIERLTDWAKNVVWSPTFIP